MKKMLFVALLSLAGVGLSNSHASAWFFCHHCCGCANICVKPYNAFSPSVFGSICADGCCPLQFGHCAPPPWMAPPPPWGGGAPCCGPSLGCAMDGSCGSCTAGAPQSAAPPGGTPTTPPPGTAPVFQGPVPQQQPAGPTTGAVGFPPGVQPTGYRPAGYYPGYAPMPWMQPPAYPTNGNMPYPNMGR